MSALRRLAVSAGFLVSLVPEAVAQTGVPLEPQAWYGVLSDEFGNPAVQLQVEKAAEGAAIKAVFDDSAKAGLPAEEQLAAARKIAEFIVANAAADPPLAVVIVGWWIPDKGMSYVQSFRFPVAELRRSPSSKAV